MGLLRIFILGLVGFVPMSAVAETYLLMAEEAGCIWCARWNAEVSEAYPKTAEGRAAPLRRYDIREGAPDGIDLDRRVSFTPTFILVRDGAEVGRIEGYPGEDFFWAVLNQLLARAEIDLKKSG